MFHIRNNAEDAVRNLLRGVAAKMGTRLHAIDYMDDGTPIELTITIDPEAGSAVFDFEGTGPQSYSSLNAPVSVCSSAVSASPRPFSPFLARTSGSLTFPPILPRAVYCLRVLVDEEIPLNAGCLAPIELRIPEGSIINPDETCAVVGGNVMTSQRVTDVVLRCFECVPLSLSLPPRARAASPLPLLALKSAALTLSSAFAGRSRRPKGAATTSRSATTPGAGSTRRSPAGRAQVQAGRASLAAMSI